MKSKKLRMTVLILSLMIASPLHGKTLRRTYGNAAGTSDTCSIVDGGDIVFKGNGFHGAMVGTLATTDAAVFIHCGDEV